MKYITLLLIVVSLAAAMGTGAGRVNAQSKTFVVTSTDNSGDSDPADGVCNTGPPTPGACTLRAAIEQANQTPDTDTINFNIPGTGVQTIVPASALPTVAKPVVIDGYSQPGASPNTNPIGQPDNAVLLIQLSGYQVGAGVDGLRITAGNTTVKGLVINDFYLGGDGLEFQGKGDNTVQGNFIGTDPTGLYGALSVPPNPPYIDCSGDEIGNGSKGVYLNGVPNNLIGGTSPAARNVIGGNGRGCSVPDGAPTPDGINISGAGASANVVIGNYIGATSAGSTASLPQSSLSNSGDGVRINGAPNNTIGGISLAERNVIVGNKGNGVQISGGAATNNVVEGNLIGLDATGSSERGNNGSGVLLKDAPNNLVGGTASGARNVISGNGSQGVYIQNSAATGNRVEGNYIGTKIGGDVAAGNDSDGVMLDRAPGNTIGGTTAEARNVISANGGRGIRFQGAEATGNLVQGNYMGTTASGVGALEMGNSHDGVFIAGGGGNTIGGTSPGARNIISGNGGSGIQVLSDGNVIQGNYIGLDVTGSNKLGNGRPVLHTGDGILVTDGKNNQIGGTVSGASNVISGNVSTGVTISGGASSANSIQGNLVGTDATGTLGRGNGSDGIALNSATNTLIGGTSPSARNVIAGNGTTFLTNGILIQGSGATGNQVKGNYIGTDITGARALGNSSDGVFIFGAPGVTIGGTTAGARNVISGNGGRGVEIFGNTATGVVVQGNIVGLDAGGSAALGNGADGIVVTGAPGNTIGGSSAGAGNVVSANGAMGVEILDLGATGNIVKGNRIGTDISGSAGLGNVLYGVFVNGAPGNSIGGTDVGAANVISGNDAGVFISGLGATGNSVRGNSIGTNVAGTAPLGNAFDGVRVGGSASNNMIGGSGSGAGNLIAFNGGNGVLIDSGTGDSILSNSIFSNAGLGIDLGFDGLTPNDPGDGDSGANNLQNFPVVSSAQSSNSGTALNGSLNSTAGASFTLQFFSSSTCDPSGNGEGKTFLGALDVQTDGSGNTSFNQTFPPIVTAGYGVSGTATDANGNTSEFSACKQVTGVSPPPLTQGDIDCSGTVNSVDALRLLRYVSGINVTQSQGCPPLGTNLPPKWGDVDCNGAITSVDALKVLRFVAGLPVSQSDPCPRIGQPVS